MIESKLSDYFTGLFKDRRIEKRMGLFVQAMILKVSAVVNKCHVSRAEKTATYRMLKNDKVQLKELCKGIYRHCKEHVTTSHVLCIEDTSEINYNTHMGRITKQDPDIGPVGKNSNGGYFLHPVLVVDAISEMPLGFSFIHLWNRLWDKKDKKSRTYKQQAIEEKESFRWIESALESKKNLPSATTQTIVGDREADIYEALYQIPHEGMELLIRSSSDRLITEGQQLLSQKMKSLEIAHTYTHRMRGNHSRKNRDVKLSIRFSKVTLLKPSNVVGDYPDTLSINCIYVVEDAFSVPKGEKPIEWRLLTTHRVDNAEDALRCVRWYKLRWYIEEIFRLIKSQGLNVEAAQLENGKSLKKLVVVSLVAALHIMSLKLSYDQQDEDLPASIHFSEDQILLLEIIGKSLQGKTEKLKNPYKKGSLVWAAWVIARLGCWDGYKSQSPPGYITFSNGYKDFISKYQVFNMIKDVCRE